MLGLTLVLGIAALMWIKAFRYMALSLLVGVIAYQMSGFTSFNMQPQYVVGTMALVLAGTLLFELVVYKVAKKDGQ